MLYDGLKRVR